MSAAPIFNKIALIGFGLIGGSIARAARAQGLVGEIVTTARSEKTRARVQELLRFGLFRDSLTVQGCRQHHEIRMKFIPQPSRISEWNLKFSRTARGRPGNVRILRYSADTRSVHLNMNRPLSRVFTADVNSNEHRSRRHTRISLYIIQPC